MVKMIFYPLQSTVCSYYSRFKFYNYKSIHTLMCVCVGGGNSLMINDYLVMQIKAHLLANINLKLKSKASNSKY